MEIVIETGEHKANTYGIRLYLARCGNCYSLVLKSDIGEHDKVCIVTYPENSVRKG